MSNFSVILNSNNKISGTNCDATFFFDFSLYENCNYNVSFNFSGIPTSLNTNLTTGSEPPLLHVSLGQKNIFLTGNRVSQLIGPLYIFWSQSKSMIVGTSTDSLQTLRVSLPQNQISVRLSTYADAIWLDPGSLEIRDYILILTFEKVSK